MKKVVSVVLVLAMSIGILGVSQSNTQAQTPVTGGVTAGAVYELNKILGEVLEESKVNAQINDVTVSASSEISYDDDYTYEVTEMTPEELEEEMYYDSLEYLAACVEAEAGNQPLYGRQLVVDVVLNRIDDPDFPDNIYDVI